MTKKFRSFLITASLAATVVVQAVSTTDNQSSFSSEIASLGLSTNISEAFTTYSAGSLSKETDYSFNGFTASAVDTSGDMNFYIANDLNIDSPFYAPFSSSQHLGWGEINPFGPNGTGRRGPTITLDFAPGTKAVSFDFLDTDKIDRYQIYVNGANVSFGSAGDAFPPASWSRGVSFFGVTNNGADINQVQFVHGRLFDGYVSPFGIDNVQIANAAVPEPTTIVFLIGCIALAIGIHQRRRNIGVEEA